MHIILYEYDINYESYESIYIDGKEAFTANSDGQYLNVEVDDYINLKCSDIFHFLQDIKDKITCEDIFEFKCERPPGK